MTDDTQDMQSGLEQIITEKCMVIATLREENEAQAAEIEKLRGDADFEKRSRARQMLRRHMNAPEDPHVAVLCERYGYGAVMDAASRLWARKDSIGAFYIGGCISMRTDDEARAALNEKGPGD